MCWPIVPQLVRELRSGDDMIQGKIHRPLPAPMAPFFPITGLIGGEHTAVQDLNKPIIDKPFRRFSILARLSQDRIHEAD